MSKPIVPHGELPRKPVITLREYQKEALAAVAGAHQRGVKRQIIALATGMGKTLIAAEIIRQARAKGYRVLFLAHRDELLCQARDKIALVYPGAQMGLVKAESDDVDAPIVIGSIQTLQRKNRLTRLSATFKIIVVDEMHHAVEGSGYFDVLHHLGAFRMNDLSSPLVVGLSATPERADGQGLGNMWQEIVYRLDILDGIRAGYLADLRAVQIHLEVDFKRLHTIGGDFKPGEATDLLQEAHAPEVAVKAWFEHAKDRKTLVFTPTVALAYDMAEAFQRAGVAAEAVDGNTETDERRAILKRFRDGKTLVLANCAVLTEGFDAPDVSCILIARPTKSHSLYVQMIGRGTRKYPGKDDCLVIDLVGATSRHDLQTCATLFNIPPHALARKTVTEAIEDIERAREQQAQQASHVPLTTKSHYIDLYRKMPMHWLQHAGAYVLNLADKGYLELAPQQADTWRVVLHPKDRGCAVTLSEGLSLTYAQGVGEDYARQVGAGGLNNPKAKWRQVPATDEQKKYMRRLGIHFGARTTKGEACDRIQLAKMKKGA